MVIGMRKCSDIGDGDAFDGDIGAIVTACEWNGGANRGVFNSGDGADLFQQLLPEIYSGWGFGILTMG